MGCSSEHEEHQLILVALTAYLRAHIQAADTFEGIRDWWLPRDRFPAPDPQALEQALATLVQLGQLVRFESSNGLVLYINRAGNRLH
ncbi:MAG: hypothetical protein AB1899_07950 [Pseudomonadota bacterium]